VILERGPGKIIMPDGTEIDVIFEEVNIRFDLSGMRTYRIIASEERTSDGADSSRSPRA
jgi:hypothetical protein